MEILNNNDVLHTGSSALMFQCTFKTSEYLALVQSKLEEEQIFGAGMDCEVLSPNQPWRRGKVRMRLEFDPESQENYPPSAVSSLDSTTSGSTTSGSTTTNSITSSINAPEELVQPRVANNVANNMVELPPPVKRWVRDTGMWS
ncbi:MAG: hypothetical protein HC835_15770 [Oscillatoriales cyanobacterium RM2_1_1]|nr:hypothetical protein [Oscillatoriales cyanobacterium SM2_3_0]NJO46955.1 hypothetical protein [Oscillatoriales cyanobacterium RM2_1_1]